MRGKDKHTAREIARLQRYIRRWRAEKRPTIYTRLAIEAAEKRITDLSRSSRRLAYLYSA